LTDLGSTNGTFDRQGLRLTGAYALKPHDAVRLGATWLEVLAKAAPAGGTRVMEAFPSLPPAGALVAPSPAPSLPAAVAPIALTSTPVVTSRSAEWRPTIETFTCRSTELSVHFTSGRVGDSSKNLETHVYGSAGGYVQGGSSYVNRTHLTSSTTVHDTVFVVDSEGKEHAFQLSDFNLAVRPGNEVSVVWLIRPGKDSGHYVAVRNHTTRQTFFHDTKLKKTLFPFTYTDNLFNLLMFGLFLFTGGISLIPLLIWLFMVKGTIREFKQKLTFAQG
jgi:hypothetical protein